MRALLPQLSVIFGRPHVPAATAMPQFQRTRSRITPAETMGGQEPLLNLSLAGHLLLPVVIFVISLLSIEFSHLSHFFGGLWASNAVITAAFLRHVRNIGNYSSIAIGGIVAMTLAGAVTGDPPELSAILTLANMAEVGTALVLLALCRIDASNLASFRNLLIFIGIAGGLAPIAGVIICATTIAPNTGDYWVPLWRNWYVGHALAMIIVAPFVISVTSQEWHTLRIRERLPEVVVLLASFVAIAAGAAYFRPVIFVLAPTILFATVRFGLIGATVTTLVTALLATGFVVLGIGQPFVPISELSLRILYLQVFLAITSFWSLPTAALLTERDRLLAGLSRANALLTVESERKSTLVLGLRRHLTMAEENERLRLSHELHDQAGQSLIAAILELNEIDPLITEGARDRLHLVRRKMEDLGKTLHHIAWELRPAAIDELGLRKALASYIADWGEQCDTEVDFHCDDPTLDDVPSDIGTAIYRVVQEGFTNIVKHAQRPSNVSVVIRRSDAILQVIVEDNGCGFDVGAMAEKTNFRRGLGLDGMRERLSLIGGTLEVESAIGAGTTIFARIVLEVERSAA
jgi:signal transduction histidine kinase